MAEMVWCQSCKTAVWAYDHQSEVDLRGICNMLKLPCPKCGDIGNFDGWASNDMAAFYDSLPAKAKEELYDWWSAMKYVAEAHNVAWEISPNCSWFKRPSDADSTYLEFTKDLQRMIRVKETSHG